MPNDYRKLRQVEYSQVFGLVLKGEYFKVNLLNGNGNLPSGR